jgi:hypothetical protein
MQKGVEQEYGIDVADLGGDCVGAEIPADHAQLGTTPNLLENRVCQVCVDQDPGSSP